MGELVLGVDFKAKKRLEPTLQQQAVAIIGGLSLDCDPEVLLAFYESDTSPCEMIPYHAPEADPA